MLALPLTQNPYVYGLNHPTRYTDPSGEFPWLIIGGIVAGAAIGGLYGASIYWDTTQSTGQVYNPRDAMIAAGMGAVTGALLATTLTTGSLTPMWVALAGLTSAGAQIVMDNGCLNWPNLAGAYMSGALATALFGAIVPRWANTLIGGSVFGAASSIIGDAANRIIRNALAGATLEIFIADMYNWWIALPTTAFWGGIFGGLGAIGLKGSLFIANQRTASLTREASLVYQTAASIKGYSRSAFRGGLPHNSHMATALLETYLVHLSKYEILVAKAVQARALVVPVRDGLFSIFNSNVASALWGQ